MAHEYLHLLGVEVPPIYGNYPLTRELIASDLMVDAAQQENASEAAIAQWQAIDERVALEYPGFDEQERDALVRCYCLELGDFGSLSDEFLSMLTVATDQQHGQFIMEKADQAAAALEIIGSDIPEHNATGFRVSDLKYLFGHISEIARLKFELDKE